MNLTEAEFYEKAATFVPETKTPRKKSPTARTLEILGRRGWPAQVVERWLPGFRDGEQVAYGKRKDLFGVIDILALDGEPGCLGIQASVGGSIPARVKKAKEEPLLRSWLEAGNRFQVWGWREVWVETGAKTKAIRWKARIVELHLNCTGEIEERETEN